MVTKKTTSKTTAKAAATATDATPYDPGKRYAVELARTVEHEGFTYRPGPTPIEMSGELANTHAAAIAAAHELPPEAEHPAAPESVHELAP